MKKRFVLLAMAAVMSCSLVACGEKESSEKKETTAKEDTNKSDKNNTNEKNEENIEWTEIEVCDILAYDPFSGAEDAVYQLDGKLNNEEISYQITEEQFGALSVIAL